MTAYYNEIDPYAAKWLRNLISAGHIADGIVDERSIEDVHPRDLDGFTQCHFFAGIGVWSYALRRAGWPDDRPVWTGSCPCQPFSSAGKGAGFADERHLWPAFHHLIRERRPPVDLGYSKCEGLAFGQRLDGVPDGARRADAGKAAERTGVHACGVAYSECALRGCEAKSARHYGPQANRPTDRAGGCGGASCRLADADGRDACPEGVQRSRQHGQQPQNSGVVCVAPAGPTNGIWRAADWLLCRDGRWRPVEPGTQPLATGIANRVGRLRAYGNAINAEAAHAFIAAYLESI